MVKAPERVHFPNRAWERVDLPSTKDLPVCMQELEQQLQYFPEAMKTAAVERLRCIDKLIRRSDSLAHSEIQEDLIPVKSKERQREKNREKHAVKAANLEANIEKEILQRAMEGL